MELLILSQNEELVTTIEKELLTNAVQHEVLNNEHTVSFTMIGNHGKAVHVKEGNLIAFEDVEGDFQLFEITLIEDVRGDGSLKEAICTHTNGELLDEHIEDIRPTNQTAEYALTQALQGTRWQVGTVAELGSFSTNFYRESPKSAIAKIIETWGGELRYRVTIADNKITGRYVDLLARRGSDTGKTYEHGKDLVEVTRSIDVSTLKTAVRGYGKGEEIGDGFSRRITFEDVEWSIEKGDPADKPLGQDWIGDDQARETWGRTNDDGTIRHRFGRFEDSDEEDQAALLKHTYEYLQTVNQPIANYSGKVVDLFRLNDYEHERAILGDTAAILDDELTPVIEVKSRIIELKRDLLDASRDEMILGQFLPLYSDRDDAIDRIIAIVDDRSGVWDKPPDSTIDPEKYPDIQPSQPVVTAHGAFATVKINWDFVYGEFYTQAFELHASEVQGFTTSPENLVFRGLLDGYNFVGESNKQYYFRVRAINFHGRSSGFSEEVTATTARIISDDILFGEEIAAELRELSKKAEILAGGTVGIDKMKEEALEAIQETAKQYTDEEIQEAEKEINKELAEKAGLDFVDGRFTLVDSDLADLLDEMEDLEEYASNIDQKADSINLNVSALTQTVDGNTTSISNAESSITQLSTSIILKAEQDQVNTIEGDVKSVSNQVSILSVDVDGITTSVKSLESDIDNLDVRVRSSETSITQLSGSIALNASQLDSVEGRMTQAESSLTVHADQIVSKVERDGIISSINQSPESIQIKAEMIKLDGDVYITDGTTYIKDGVIGSAAIANAAITRAHLGEAIIGTAQIDDASITNAKIANVSADKINVGELSGITISGVTIKGSIFQSMAQDSTFELIGGDMRLDKSNGQYVTVSPDGIKGYNAGGDLRFQADRSLIFSSALGTSNTNVYLGSDDETRSVKYASLPGGGGVEDYIYTPVRASGFYGNFWNVNRGGTDPVHLYARPLGGGELRVTMNHTTDAFAPVRASGFYGSFVEHRGEGSHLYARPSSGGELRVTRADTLTSYVPARASGFYGAFLDHNGSGSNIYIRPSSGGEVQVTLRGTTNSYVPVRASKFNTSSSRTYKTNIESLDQNGLNVINQLKVVKYDLISDIESGIVDDRQVGFISEDNSSIATTDGMAINTYKLVSYNVKATQELSVKVGDHDKRINDLEIENQLLKAQIQTIQKAS